MNKPKVCNIITRLVHGGAQENTILTIVWLKNKYDNLLIGGIHDTRRGNILDQVKNKDQVKTIVIPELRNTINPYYLLTALIKLFLIIKKNKFDIVHTHSTHAGIIGRIAAKLAGTPIILHTIHGLSFHEKLHPVERFIAWGGENFVSYFTDKILSVSQVMIEKSINARIAKREKFVLVRSGFDFKYKNIDPNYLKNKIGIKNKNPIVMKICGLVPLKGCEDFIEVARRVYLNNKKVTFVLVGDGELKPFLEKKIQELELNDTFLFAGKFESDVIYDVIKLADFVVHLSYREGLARVIPQSLACGKPVIAYDVDGANEVINQKNGFLIDEGDIDSAVITVEKLLNDNKLLKKLTGVSVNIIKNEFSVKKMVNDIDEAYQDLLSKR